MGKRTITLASIILLGFATSVLAQDNNSTNKFNFSIDFLNLNVSGSDSYVGDIVTYREVSTPSGSYFYPNYDYGAKYKPLLTLMNSRRSVLWEASYGSKNNYLSVRTWRLNTDGALEGRVVSPVGEPNEFTAVAVRMWDQVLVPLVNLNEKSNLGPVSYWAKSDLRVRKTDVAFNKNVSNNLDLSVGLSSVGLSNNRNEGQTHHAFIYYFFGSYHFDNRVKLESHSSSQYNNFWGPSFGLKGKFGFKRLEARVNLNQSFLTGKVQQSGNWIDIDDISAVSGPIGGPFTPQPWGDTLLHGEFPYSLEERKSLLVTESQFKLSYRLTKNLTAGGSLVMSYWDNVATAPSWSVPGEWTGLAGSGWKLNKTSLFFHGYSLSVGLSF